jgi:hypothetical protein
MTAGSGSGENAARVNGDGLETAAVRKADQLNKRRREAKVGQFQVADSAQRWVRFKLPLTAGTADHDCSPGAQAFNRALAIHRDWLGADGGDPEGVTRRGAAAARRCADEGGV